MTENTESTDKKANGEEKAESKDKKVEEKAPVVTQHTLQLGDNTLNYTVTAGMMPLKNVEKDEIEAEIFFTAYTVDQPDDAPPRPLTFVFNGGPGSASVWLHLGAFGPKRVKMQDEGWMPAPPYELVKNDHTWLDLTDMVFIDPVGTGYSRATKKEHNQKFWGLQGDLESVGEFIRLYLVRYNRWNSPLLLAGESYGTTRAAGLSGHLVSKGIALNGIVLISTILNFQTVRFERGNDLPYSLFLPTYTATAWYHKRLPDDLQEKPLREVLDEVEQWIETDYTLALMKGGRLTGDERQKIVDQLMRYTGLSPQYIDGTNLRVNIHRFGKELLRDEKWTVGRLDSRYKGMDALHINEFPEFDPSLTAIVPPYTAMMNHYARTELGYETDTEYEVLSFNVNRNWEWDRGKFPDTSESLRQAFARNPFMKLFAAMGYYDMATPYYATQYTLDHSDLDPRLKDNLHTAYYEAGHMLYLDVKSLEKLKADFSTFLNAALGG